MMAMKNETARRIANFVGVMNETISQVSQAYEAQVKAGVGDEDGDSTAEKLESDNDFLIEGSAYKSEVSYGDSQGIYGQIVDAIRIKDFSGRDIEVVPSVEGVSNGPAVIFNLPYPYMRWVVVYKPNATNWAATAIIEINGELMQKAIPWKVRQTDSVDSLADEVALLSYRLSLGDLRDH